MRATQLAQERKDFEELRAERELQTMAIDPGPLRKICGVGKLGEQARRLAEERIELFDEMRGASEAVARLDLRWPISTRCPGCRCRVPTISPVSTRRLRKPTSTFAMLRRTAKRSKEKSATRG